MKTSLIAPGEQKMDSRTFEFILPNYKRNCGKDWSLNIELTFLGSGSLFGAFLDPLLVTILIFYLILRNFVGPRVHFPGFFTTFRVLTVWIFLAPSDANSPCFMLNRALGGKMHSEFLSFSFFHSIFIFDLECLNILRVTCLSSPLFLQDMSSRQCVQKVCWHGRTLWLSDKGSRQTEHSRTLSIGMLAGFTVAETEKNT